MLAVVLCREIFEGCKAIVARHILLELLLQGLETDAVLLVGAKLGDVEAGGVRHVDHVGVGQHRELVLLGEKDTGCEGDPEPSGNASLPYLHNQTCSIMCQCGVGLTNNKPTEICQISLLFFLKVAFSWFYERSTFPFEMFYSM